MTPSPAIFASSRWPSPTSKSACAMIPREAHRQCPMSALVTRAACRTVDALLRAHDHDEVKQVKQAEDQRRQGARQVLSIHQEQEVEEHYQPDKHSERQDREQE